MSEKKVPFEVNAKAYETQLAELVANKEWLGHLLTAFLVLELGEENPYKGCIVQILEGPDAGKKFVANFGKAPRMLEPLVVSLISAVEEE